MVIYCQRFYVLSSTAQPNADLLAVTHEHSRSPRLRSAPAVPLAFGLRTLCRLDKLFGIAHSVHRTR